MCVLQSTEKGAEDVENVSMVTPQLHPPPTNMHSYTGGELFHGTSLFLRA